MAIAYAFSYGSYCSIGAAISNLLNPFGFTPSEIALTGGISLAAGIVAALAFGVLLDHTGYYRKVHVTLSGIIVLSVTIFTVLISSGASSVSAILIPNMFFGIASVSFFPTSLSYGAELTFPLQPAMVNACMNFMGQLCAFMLMSLTIYITDFDASSTDLLS